MKVAIVYPRANIDTVPSLIGASEQFAEAGYEVDLYTYRHARDPSPSFAAPGLKLRPLGLEGLADQSTAGLRSMLKRAGWLPDAARAPLARTYQALGAGLASGTRLAARARSAVLERPEAYTCVIGVDPDGLEMAHAVARGGPVGYYSLELLLSADLTTAAEIQLKVRERELSRQAAFVVVQDEDRARLLVDDNTIDWERIVLVPNAPLGPARRTPSRYWHARFDLPEDTRVVIHSGSLGAWTGIEQIVASTREWPSGWALVIHTRYDAESSAYVDGLRRSADQWRVHFSLKPVPRQEYDPLIDGGDVGIAFYVPNDGSAFTQRNVQTIGLSSGKLAYYLRSGLPVIVNRASSIAPLIEQTGSGVAVSDAAEIGPALDRIATDYDTRSISAMQFFNERLDFRKAFAEVVRRVDALR